MGTLERLPGWAKRLDEMSGHFSEAGLNGLLDYHAETNTLGEILAQGIVKPADLRAWFTEQVGRHEPPAASGGDIVPQSLLDNPQSFWTTVWSDLLGKDVVGNRNIIIPPFPALKPKTREAITGGLGMWIPVYLPNGLTEEDYPESFIKPDWGKHLNVADIQRRPLPGRWVIVETIRKPDWNDQKGYGNGNDPLATALGLKTRFVQSWDDLHEIHLPKVAKRLGLGKKAVRLLTAEEWNLVGNLFLWLNANRNMALPDLGSTNSWEWVENACGVGSRLIVGGRVSGGLADVGYDWLGLRGDDIGFRVLAVL